MTEIHIINDIVKKIDKTILLSLFDKLSVPELVATTQSLNTRNRGTLVTAFAALSDEQQKSVGEVLEEIAPVGSESKNIPVMRALLTECKIATPKDIDDFNAATLATWCYVNTPGLWNTLLGRTAINARKLSDWTCFNLVFKSTPPRGLMVQREKELTEAAQKFIMRHEYRGHHCLSECYTVENVENIVFKLTDHRSVGEFWDDDLKGYKVQDGAPPFKVVLSFNYETSRLAILFTSGGTTLHRDSLAHELAATLFGADSYSRMDEVKYDLQSLKDKWELTPPLENHNLKRAVVIGLELNLNSTRKSRRVYIEKDSNLQEAIRDEIGADRLLSPFTTVARAHIRLTYDTPRRANATHTFILSESSISGYYTVPRYVQKMLQDLLNAYNLIRNAQ